MEAVIIKKNLQPYLALIFGFLLGIHNGHIALWEDGTKNPIRIFPYSASSLPAADQKALEKGIPFESTTDLIQRLEDYLS